MKAFKHQVLKLVKSDHLPGYKMVFNNNTKFLTFYNRKCGKTAKALFDDQIKDLSNNPIPMRAIYPAQKKNIK